jgi:hypothetical protein
MSDPKRWLEDDDLSPVARRMMLAGQGDAPPRAAVQQGWASFLALSGMPLAETSPQGLTGASASGLAARAISGTAVVAGGAKASLSTAVIVKTFALGAALGVSTVLAVQGGSRLLRADEAPRVAGGGVERRDGTAAAASATTAPGTGAAPGEQREETESRRELAVPALGVASRMSSSPSASFSPVAPLPGASVATFPLDASERALLLKAEARDLADAKAMLVEGRAAEALVRLGRSFERFKGGSLGEEREVLVIEALSQSGQAALAGVRASDFLVRHPRSPLKERVQRFAR